MIATGRDVSHARGGHIDALEVSIKACSFLKCLRLCFSKPRDYQVRYLSPRPLKWLPACVPSLPRPGVRDHFSSQTQVFRIAPHSESASFSCTPKSGVLSLAVRPSRDQAFLIPGSPACPPRGSQAARLCPGSRPPAVRVVPFHDPSALSLRLSSSRSPPKDPCSGRVSPLPGGSARLSALSLLQTFTAPRLHHQRSS